jgi:hypothetical protein
MDNARFPGMNSISIRWESVDKVLNSPGRE